MLVCLFVWPFFQLKKGVFIGDKETHIYSRHTEKKSLCNTEERLGKLKIPVSFWELRFDFFGFCFVF